MHKSGSKDMKHRIKHKYNCIKNQKTMKTDDRMGSYGVINLNVIDLIMYTHFSCLFKERESD